jgi:quinol monooxygenase YgiN
MEVEAASELLGIARFMFHEGKVDDFERLSEQCMEIVRTKDNGTLQYDISFNDNESEAIVIERYRDSEALIEHLAQLGDDLMAAMMATASVHGETLGEPSARLRAMMEGTSVRLFTPFLSLSSALVAELWRTHIGSSVYLSGGMTDAAALVSPFTLAEVLAIEDAKTNP